MINGQQGMHRDYNRHNIYVYIHTQIPCGNRISFSPHCFGRNCIMSQHDIHVISVSESHGQVVSTCCRKFCKHVKPAPCLRVSLLLRILHQSSIFSSIACHMNLKKNNCHHHNSKTLFTSILEKQNRLHLMCTSFTTCHAFSAIQSSSKRIKIYMYTPREDITPAQSQALLHTYKIQKPCCDFNRLYL